MSQATPSSSSGLKHQVVQGRKISHLERDVGKSPGRFGVPEVTEVMESWRGVAPPSVDW